MAPLRLQELGLTPAQLAEVEALDEDLVSAWLEAALSAERKLRSPTGWFLTGVRSGNKPELVADARKQERIRLAEIRIANIGHVLPDEHELVEEIFGARALLEPWAGDELQRARMLELWRAGRRVPDIVWPPHSQQAYADSGSATRAI